MMQNNAQDGAPPWPGGHEVPRLESDEAIVQAYFDRDPALPHEALREAIRRSPRVAEEIGRTQRIVNALRSPVGAPDLSRPILDAVDRERSFVPPRMRRRVSAVRVAIAASIIGGTGLIALLHSVSRPHPVIVAPDPVAVRDIAPPVLERSTLNEPQRPSRAVAGRVRATLTLGDTSAYDLPMSRSGGEIVMRSPSSGRGSVYRPGDDLWSMPGPGEMRVVLGGSQTRPLAAVEGARAMTISDMLQRSAPSLKWSTPLAAGRGGAGLGGSQPLAATFIEQLLSGRSEERVGRTEEQAGARDNQAGRRPR